jgi:hypothetical protein
LLHDARRRSRIKSAMDAPASAPTKGKIGLFEEAKSGVLEIDSPRTLPSNPKAIERTINSAICWTGFMAMSRSRVQPSNVNNNDAQNSRS